MGHNKNLEQVKKFYTYVSNGEKKTVWCTLKEFLVIKDAYDDNGLTEVEQELYDEIKTEFNYPIK